VSIENRSTQDYDPRFDGAAPVAVTVRALTIRATAFSPQEASEAERAAAELEWNDSSA